jgi:hypothetical protein
MIFRCKIDRFPMISIACSGQIGILKQKPRFRYHKNVYDKFKFYPILHHLL